MIRAFGVLGSESMAGKTAAITGGIAESLIAVSFGLAVAILAIIPLNYLSSRLEKRRREIEAATSHLELLVGKHEFFLLATLTMVSLSMIDNQGNDLNLPGANSARPQDQTDHTQTVSVARKFVPEAVLAGHERQ